MTAAPATAATAQPAPRRESAPLDPDATYSHLPTVYSPAPFVQLAWRRLALLLVVLPSVAALANGGRAAAASWVGIWATAPLEETAAPELLAGQLLQQASSRALR